jgi:hypothetical protein
MADSVPALGDLGARVFGESARLDLRGSGCMTDRELP